MPEPSEDFAADPVELLFDLAFAFSQLVGLHISTSTWDTVGKAGLIFLLLWLRWTQFAWTANAGRLPPDDSQVYGWAIRYAAPNLMAMERSCSGGLSTAMPESARGSSGP